MKNIPLGFISILSWMILLMCCPCMVQSQAPQSIAYQAIVRGSDGNPSANQPVSVRITLHQGSDAGPEVYCEIHSTTTNPFGLVNLQIGQGTVVFGSFPAVDWETGVYYLELELDPEGGTAFVPMGTTQLVSVPYALFSERAAQAYFAGDGIDITDGTITNIAPDQPVNLFSGIGIDVQGTYPDFIITNTAPNTVHTGDATGSEALMVTGLQGRPVAALEPFPDQVLQWDGTQWQPATLPGAFSGWSLTGNGGTNSSINFLGTTDNQPLIFRVNNQKAGEINPINYNTFLGSQAGESSTGSYNTATGYLALYNNLSGWSNTAMGSLALANNITGGWNTACGANALFGNASGMFNTATGYWALNTNSSGNNNTANGFGALLNNTTGHSNVAVGIRALLNNTTRSNLVAVGDSALFNNGTGASELWHGTKNTAVGSKALFSNTIGGSNSAYGTDALYSNMYGGGNTAMGVNALYSNVYGIDNIAIGCHALYSNWSGMLNIACGFGALYDNTDGDENVAIGYKSMFYNTQGEYNIAVGDSALFINNIGSYCSALGHNALSHSNNDYITGLGCYANISSGVESNCSVIGAKAIVNASNKIRIGDATMTVIEGQVNWSYPSDGRFKQNEREEVKGLAFIKLLRPLVYNFDTRKYTEFLTQNMPDSLQNEYLNNKDFSESAAIRHSGFIAQEVVKAAAASGYDFDGVHVPVNASDNYSIAYGQFVVPLVKAVQEQQVMIEELHTLILELQKKVEILETELDGKK